MASVEDIQPVYEALVRVLDSRPGDVQEMALENLLASFTLACFQNRGVDPNLLLRHIYKEARRLLNNELAAINVTLKAPKGIKPN